MKRSVTFVLIFLSAAIALPAAAGASEAGDRAGASRAAAGKAGVAAGLAVSSRTAAASRSRQRRVQVRIVRPGQNPMLRRNGLTVRVRAAKRGRIRLRGVSATFDRGGRAAPLTRIVRPRFRRAGHVRAIRLPLTAAGRAAIRSCEDRDMQAHAGAVRSPVRVLVRQTAPCRPRPIDLSRAERCDFIAAPAAGLCMVPFPSNFHTMADHETETGRRINFRADAMPVNSSGVPIDPAPYNQSDGFSQGQGIVVRVPGLDNPEALAQTRAPSLAVPQRYLNAASPVVVINADTRQRHPVWAEIDSQASSPGQAVLKIHPLVNFDAGTRYIVALRNLRDSSGAILAAPDGFRYYRDMLPSNRPQINQRRSHFEDMFRRLRNASIRRNNLYLAWDFTTASDENNSGRALSMRDQAFAELGDTNPGDRVLQGDAPAFAVDSVDLNPSPEVARRISGRFAVPCFMEHPTDPQGCASGGRLRLNNAGVPVKTGTWQANFECIVPGAVVDPDPSPPVPPGPFGTTLGRAMVYGHGLMGSIGGEINATAQRMLADRGFVVCGTDEIGMSTSDLGTVIQALGNLSHFPRVADRLQQGLLNGLYLARLMIHPEGLVSRAAFRVDRDEPDPVPVPGLPNDPVGPDSELDPVIHTGPNVRAWYRGNSQGGIMGGALTALAPDFDHAALGVGAINYSVLLTRSSAWSTYSAIFNPAYSTEMARPLVLGLIQMLWDRGEPNGYAHRMTDRPLPGTPPHRVLMDVAFGDHLVTNWQSNVQARTIGARAVSPFVAAGRWPGVDSQWGIEPVPSYPHAGSAIAYWDSGPGTAPPPLTNTAPASGSDPHEHPRITGTAVEMIDRFLRPGGTIYNTCAPGPCLATP